MEAFPWAGRSFRTLCPVNSRVVYQNRIRQGCLCVEEHLPSRCRRQHRLRPRRLRLERLVRVLYAAFGRFLQRVGPTLRFGLFQSEQLLPLLRAVCSSSARICQVARVIACVFDFFDLLKMALYDKCIQFENEKPAGVIRLVEANGFYRAYNHSAYLPIG